MSVRPVIILSVLVSVAAAALGQQTAPPRRVWLGKPRTEGDLIAVPLMIDDIGDVVAGDVDVLINSETVGDVEVRKTALLDGFLLLANVVGDTLKIGFAGIRAAQGSGAFAEILVSNSRDVPQPHFALLLVSLNGDQIAVDYALPTAVMEVRESRSMPLFPDAESVQDSGALGGWEGDEPIRDGAESDAVGFLRAYPNPFNSETVIWISLRREQDLRVRVYNVTGQLVRTLIEGSRPAGPHRVVWDGTDGRGRRVATGSYLAQLEYRGFQTTVGLALVR